MYPRSLLDSIDEKALMEIMEHYMMNRLGSKNDYEAFIHLYEVPLIRAGIKQFKSQSKLSGILGLNRNTLRKKMAKHAAYELSFKEH